MAVHPNTPNPNNAPHNNNADNAHQVIPILPRAPNPNNGIMAAPNFPRPGPFMPGPYGRNLGIGHPRQMFFPPAQHQQQHRLPLAGRMPPANLLPDEDDDDERDETGPIFIKINCPVLIKGDNNVCSVDPAILTQRITMAVATSLRTMAGGIPMVNENGTPREIRVEVQAETRIEGSKNLVGEKHHHLIVKAEAQKVIAVENGEAHENALAIANAANVGGNASAGIKRKIAQREAPDFAAEGLGIKLEPFDDGDDDVDDNERDHSVKRPRRG